ncbi:hypothetical protein HYN48_13970 [Flavobacterium magnum]|uniref:Lipoprotein n=1 Tax=Flavobacterium magnum TaxID=2162713 RepID=A0A2S0RHH0_9FLAO|nr:hypothetical protein [Flavobacterium magnum]AWA31106.1 hypothetical protein HYN48_13970 [Flavobacterium magnum]
MTKLPSLSISIKGIGILLISSLFSCSSINKKIYNNSDLVFYADKKLISANYHETRELGEFSENKMIIKNTGTENLIVFSTVLENTNMFYSKKNFKRKNNNLIFDSFYRNYMSDAMHSGIKKFNFIIIPPNDSLKINISSKYANDVTRTGLRYYHFASNDQFGLIDISKVKLQESIVYLNK